MINKIASQENKLFAIILGALLLLASIVEHNI
jgi:hypothetical protein